MTDAAPGGAEVPDVGLPEMVYDHPKEGIRRGATWAADESWRSELSKCPKTGGGELGESLCLVAHRLPRYMGFVALPTNVVAFERQSEGKEVNER